MSQKLYNLHAHNRFPVFLQKMEEEKQENIRNEEKNKIEEERKQNKRRKKTK